MGWGRAAALLLAAAALGGFWLAFRPQPVLVDLAEIRRGAVEVTVDEEGVTRIRDIYEVSAPVAGRLLRADREAGDLVTAGETVVAVLEPRPPEILDARLRAEFEAALSAAEATLELARAELRRAEAERDFWRAQLRRDERLAERSTIAETQLDQTRLALATREAAVASAEAQVAVRARELDRARAALIEPGPDGEAAHAGCCLRLTAPVDGRVLEVFVESASVVAAGAPLLSIGDPEDLEIVVDLLSADAVRVAAGDPARVERWGGDSALAARVRRIEPAGFTKVSALGVEEQRVRAVLDFASPPEARRGLGHDFRVFVRIVALERLDAPIVPISALFRTGDAWTLFAVEDGVARLRPVTLGARNGERAELLSGPPEGTPVILHPGDRVAEGVRVAARPDGPR